MISGGQTMLLSLFSEMVSIWIILVCSWGLVVQQQKYQPLKVAPLSKRHPVAGCQNLGALVYFKLRLFPPIAGTNELWICLYLAERLILVFQKCCKIYQQQSLLP